MVTLGRQVRAQLPGDHEIIGHASRLDEYGSLLVVDQGGPGTCGDRRRCGPSASLDPAGPGRPKADMRKDLAAGRAGHHHHPPAAEETGRSGRWPLSSHPPLAAFASAWIIRGEAAAPGPGISAEWTPWLVAGLHAWPLRGYGWHIACPRLLRWQGTRYILTSRRIIARYGMLRRRDEQVNLASVRNVTVHQSRAAADIALREYILGNRVPERGDHPRMCRKPHGSGTSCWTRWTELPEGMGFRRLTTCRIMPRDCRGN